MLQQQLCYSHTHKQILNEARRTSSQGGQKRTLAAMPDMQAVSPQI